MFGFQQNWECVVPHHLVSTSLAQEPFRTGKVQAKNVATQTRSAKHPLKKEHYFVFVLFRGQRAAASAGV